VTIEEMQPVDWTVCARIYEEGLDVGTFENDVPSWEAWDASHLESPRLVARENGAILGWAALAPVSSRFCYRGVAENSVYVGWAARGRGVGRALLDELVQRSEDVGIWTLQAGIMDGNAASVALHAACGFRIVGTRERLAEKHGVWKDVILMERRAPSLENPRV
jgi:phosphinothricin acetyltransferase